MTMPNGSTLWNIPYERNPFFTGREDVLAVLHRALHTENRVALSHPQGISGLGGIGKTQTALEYAYRYHAEYDAVFWVRADSVTSLTSSLVELASVLQLPERNEQDQEIVVQAVLRWLRTHPDWLLIYDNIGDLSIAEPFLPKAGIGHLLFTTRAHELGGLAQRLDIQEMVPEVGALLILRRASLLALRDTLSKANADDQIIACAISRELDGLPLALDQAGAYIKEAPCPLPDYLYSYQTRRSDLLRMRGQFDQDYPASVATTWSLSFEKVREAHPASAELLNFCAFLASDAIPETMITQGATHLPPRLQEAVVHPIQLDRTISPLLAYSLLRRNADETLSFHRLVQTVLRDEMPLGVKSKWKHRAVLTVNTASPDVNDFKQWDACERWVPHALVCATWIEQEDMTLLEASRMLNQTGYYLDARARYAEAEPVYRRALEINEKQLGGTHPDTAMSLNNLAELYRAQGKYGQAEPLCQRALKIHEQQLGWMHPDTAMSLNNLANLYRQQGKYRQAEPLYQRALVIDEQVSGVDHPDTAIGLNNLAGLYRQQGRYGQAEPLYQRALLILEQQLGERHPLTATSLNNLAELYKTQSKYGQAEPLYQRALLILEQQLGERHPDTATGLDNLAELYRAQGKYKQAEPLYQQALLIHEQVYGVDHPRVATDLNNLAELYRVQGKYGQAEPLYQRALKIYEQQLGEMHTDTATSLNNLALLYKAQGKYEQAEPLYQRALVIDEQVSGVDHPDTATSLNNLAGLYRAQGKYGQAEPLYQRALVIDEQVYGVDHPEVATDLNNLAALYKTQGKYGQAERLFKRALLICEQQLGERHPLTATSLNNLATLYQQQGKYAEAERLFKRALSICEQTLGLGHPNTQTVREWYVSLLREMGREEKASALEAGDRVDDESK